ncbi:MAG: ribonuclease Z [Caldibacillus thermoamylovorans]|uniref:ribonuclease Z n=1 Tax=Bacillaceae TaxID=186817 RepID=UPI000D550198|nr:ribonuclease Z [Caldibacillus thermoamylovorans]AWI12782.1 ribonuclease Z [Caldibacillus thermoamylovorans]MDL0419869.1 ribonuclease Z [Caldibacillus thermoamylovorans]
MEITFLGTCAGMPAKYRNVTAIALKHLQDGAIWLFDCGEATQHQILHTSLKPRKIEKIFITHLHGDHIFGLPGLLGSRSFLGGIEPVTIYGPKGIRDFVEMSLSISQSHLKYDIHYVEFEDELYLDEDDFIIEAKLLDHGIPSYGYRIVEKDKPGSLMADELKKIGVKPGPIFKQLKTGATIQLEDGTIINGADFLGPAKKGRVVTILGDTRPTQVSVALARNADLLIHEATFDKDAEDIAHQYFHSTTHQAARIAVQANVKKLCITHISSRFEKGDLPFLEKQAQEIFPNTIIAEDFKKIEVKH